MPEQRDQIVRRVVHALDTTHTPEDLVRRYFDDDREVVVAAARETLEATREVVSEDRLATVVDKELIDALRLPSYPAPKGLLILARHHRAITAATILTTLAAALAALL